MAQVGAISLLSWIVTALGSMAIAYGFAQAGLFNQRAGGMSAYAEDAYGKAGLLQRLLPLLPLARDRERGDRDLRGRLPGGVLPLAVLDADRHLHRRDRAALAHDRRQLRRPQPSPGRIGSITVWGVIIPVGLLSFIGWFWFSRRHVRGGLESAGAEPRRRAWARASRSPCGRSSAWNPRRRTRPPSRTRSENVPLACMFGTLGAAVIYILSTTVIQGIVPNAELAKSTGPFGLAYAQMFNPTIGSIVMALAVHGLPRLAARLAVHDRADRQVGGRRAHVPGLLLEGEPDGRADHRA